MTKNRSMKLAVLVLALALITSCFVGSTFAKYTSSATGSDTAIVAEWSFTASGADVATEDTFTFGLFDLIKDENGTTEEDVKNNKIAPGTSGSFEIALANTSEVTAQYAITFGATLNDVPLQFRLSEEDDWSNDIATLNIAASEETKLDALDGTDSVTVYWQWAFEGNDDGDTDLGAAETLAQVQVTATVTATQVN